MGKHLSAEINSVLKNTKQFKQRATDLESQIRQRQEDFGTRKDINSKQLFHQIDDLLSKPELEDSDTATTVAPCRKDMEVLMARVASESKLLTGKYAIEV